VSRVSQQEPVFLARGPGKATLPGEEQRNWCFVFVYFFARSTAAPLKILTENPTL
jgi:hypothetical protein